MLPKYYKKLHLHPKKKKVFVLQYDDGLDLLLEFYKYEVYIQDETATQKRFSENGLDPSNKL